MMGAWRSLSGLAWAAAVAACGGNGNTAAPLADAPPLDAPSRADAAPLADAAPPADATVTGADPRSIYLELGSDVMVMDSPQTLLTTTIDLAQQEWVLVTSDGRFFPKGIAPM